MKDYYKVYLFLGICIPIRILLVFLVKDIIPDDDLKYVSIPLFLISIGFIRAMMYRQTAFESSGKGGKVWWNHMRPLHAILYLTAGILAISEPKDTWIPLLVDVVIGILAYIVYKLNLM